jgi:hypothetical protein
MLKFFSIIIFQTALFGSLIAQNRETGRFTFTRLQLEYGNRSIAAAKDSVEQTFAYQTLQLSAFLPIWSKVTGAANASNFGFFLNPMLQLSKADISIVQQSRLFINAGAGCGAYAGFGNKHLLLAQIRPQWNEDEFTISNPVMRFSSVFIYSYKWSPRLLTQAGLTYTFQFGEGLALPLLGARYQFAGGSRVSVLLPMQLSYRQLLNKQWSLIFMMRPNGGINRFENRNYFANTDANLAVHRLRSFQTGMMGVYKAKNNLRLQAGIFLITKQRITFSEDGNKSGETYYRADTNPTVLIQAGIIWLPALNNIRNTFKVNKNGSEDDDAEEMFPGF